MAARADPDRDRIDRAIQAASWLGAAVMFAYGAALSFDVLHTIAQAAGLSPVLAWLWPLGFETFMAVAAVAVLAEQRSRPGRTPWYPWVLTAAAAGSSIALNFGHPYIPLDPPPRLLVACVYGVPPTCAPFAWHLFLLRLAHRRHQDGQDPQDSGLDPASRPTSQSSWEPPPPRPTPGQPAMVRTARRPAPWSGSCWPARPRTGRCPGRTSPSRPDCPAAAPMRSCVRNAPAGPPATATSPAVTTRHPDHDTPPGREERLMPERSQLTGPEAARRRRAWLDGRHRQNRDLVLVLLRYAPEPDVARALDQLPAGELAHLACLLTQATDLHQVAGGIVRDLHQRLDGRPAGPPSGEPGPSTASSMDLVVPSPRRPALALARGRGCRGVQPPGNTGPLDRPGSGGADGQRCRQVKGRGERSWPEVNRRRRRLRSQLVSEERLDLGWGGRWPGAVLWSFRSGIATGSCPFRRCCDARPRLRRDRPGPG